MYMISLFVYLHLDYHGTKRMALRTTPATINHAHISIATLALGSTVCTYTIGTRTVYMFDVKFHDHGDIICMRAAAENA